MGRKKSTLERHPLVTIAVLLLLWACLVAVVAESFLRKRGRLPGRAAYRTVDFLVDRKLFYTDGEGIFKANRDAWANDPWGAINEDGFRGREFVVEKDDRKRVLFLGDSFTFGASAKPVTESFVDLVERTGKYAVYNAGIPGADPVQYEALAKKYIPELMPDIVAVGFFMGNDLMRDCRPLAPNKSLFYVTNAGWIMAYNEDYTVHFDSAEKAYGYWIKGNKNTVVATRNIFYRSVVGTMLWNRIIRKLVGPGHTMERKRTAAEEAEPCFRKALRTIRRIAGEHNAEFVLFLIQNHPMYDWGGIGENLRYLDEFSPHIPDYSSYTMADYSTLPDEHFSNAGHEKFAEFVLKTFDRDEAPAGREATLDDTRRQ